jgi:hypothetical protein
MTPYARARHRQRDCAVVFPVLWYWHPTPVRAIVRHMWRERELWR